MLRLLAAFALLCVTIGIAQTDSPNVTIGVLAFRNGENTIDRWSPTAEYLHQTYAQFGAVILARAACPDIERLSDLKENPSWWCARMPSAAFRSPGTS